VVPDESLKLLVIAHEEGRHELTRTPSVNVCCGHLRSGAEVLGDLLEIEVFPYVLLPVFFFYHASVSAFCGQISEAVV
jgi:hypothetical protein